MTAPGNHGSAAGSRATRPATRISLVIRLLGAACGAIALESSCSLNEPGLLLPDAAPGGGGSAGTAEHEGGPSSGGRSGATSDTGGAGGKAKPNGGAPPGTGGHVDAGGSSVVTDAGVGGVDASIGSGCMAPREDCNQREDDGCETDTSKDTHHCGACNHDCLGGACKFGECQPVRLIDRLAPYVQLAQDGVNLYLTSYDHVVRSVPLGGGAVRTVAVSPDFPTDIATDGTFVYWVTGTLFEDLPTLRRAPVDGGGDAGNPEVLYRGVVAGSVTEIMGSVAVDATNIYWSVFDRDTGAAAFLKRAKSGGAAQRVFPPSGYQPKSASGTLTVSGNALYSGGGYAGAWLLRAATNGSSFQRLFDSMMDGGMDGSVSAVTVSGGVVYFARILDGVVFGPYGLGLYSVPAGGGTVKHLADGALSGIAVDSTYVYYTTRTEVARVPVGGGLSHVLASDHPGRELVMDSRAIYWDEVGGPPVTDGGALTDSIWMLAK